MITVNELFETCNIQDITNGYAQDMSNEDYVCLICGKRYSSQEVYSFNNAFYLAEKAVKMHIQAEHGSVIEHWLDFDKSITGLSEQQINIIRLITRGLNDKEISIKLGDISESTVRNHRFKLREKARQARIFLAIMNYVEDIIQDKKKFIAIPRNIKHIDERFQVTSEEKNKIINKYFNDKQQLLRYPKKEKERLIVLQKILELFDPNKKYKETEVDSIIKNYFLNLDYILIRRAFIEYGFMDRKNDGTAYWVK
ncbi:MAG: DUF2087 domain-containing protein [Bacteroidales bacterium]|jgi:hypothetical protein|nr:DUF2087 domain-containing protein [Candidatus Cloacimonadota bacterium]MDD2388065.1 DUF2087 domain-containing protein [Bacteroidales bacterium]MDD4156141.1 DUF2087 domain-containing protein [Candidatus Cloacimonadota bacterium]